MSDRKLIAIDVGRKRIGVAKTDRLQIIASPVGTFTPTEILPALTKLINEGPTEAFVVGWPLTEQGTEGEATHMVKSFTGELKKAFPDIPIHFHDERYTSVMAQQSIREAGLKKKKREDKSLVDQVAATLLLRHYLETKK